MTTISDDLAAAVRLARTAVSRDRKHAAALRCVLVERAGDVVRAVATDKHRLVVCERPAGPTDPARVLLDPDTLEPAGDVEDDFPDYERFLPADPAAVATTAHGPSVLRALEEAADDGPVSVHVGTDGVRFGGDDELHVDPDLLHDALELAGDGQVIIEAAGPFAPLAVRAPGLLTLVMPVRVAPAR
ncbi:MAG TPA: hypothetical protein VM262_05150 [Acidimicrobiales bacterium]|nr:hypothetical protein [Acidimicrobiales bacterium]